MHSHFHFPVVAAAFLSIAAGAAADDTRLVSAQMSAVILAGLPQYDPRKAGGGDSGLNPGKDLKGTATTLPKFEGIQLPAFVVQDLKALPPEDEMLTRGDQAVAAMNDYLGGANGFDRGFLNRYTLAELWQKIPVIGKLPFVGAHGSISNKERAMQISDRVKLTELKALLSLGPPR